MFTPEMSDVGRGRFAGAKTGRRRKSFRFHGMAWVVLACVATGCATPKRTWADWMAARAEMTSVPAAFVPPPIAGQPSPPVYHPDYTNGSPAHVGGRMNLQARNPDFPATHIEMVYIDLTCPSNAVHLAWAGPLAELGPAGPWRSSAGRGQPCYDCNEVGDSNTQDSWCTPKGVFTVAGFDDHLEAVPACCYATWVIHKPRFIAIHSHRDIPFQAESHGCIRVPFDVAQLIHNNSLAGVTRVCIYGEWTRPMGLRN